MKNGANYGRNQGLPRAIGLLLLLLLLLTVMTFLHK
jgi:hypothetical protein